MKTPLKYALPLGLLMASAGALASGPLTPHQCSSYPFRPTHGEVTHRDLMRELNELESVGYRPALDSYSPDITDARARLMAKYATDCKPDQHAAGVPPSNS
ncbi:DUF4148 domain-containing protein [Paraburkholderia phenazinium]|jgi:hypothetical protein|uniref:DUF4148 domain-containing protein n=1 Tax=Paraburkholderia phenazinium TaxID=60549 RepID=A0A1G7ZTB7_9BURK|nr:DUF4148 domain-containing protein [Paraburkholderia phenazinium]SDH11929.1 hypothetical protein SAMN05216466_107166 [Paraburkholderia phenazinium]